MEAAFRNFKNAKARHENAWRNYTNPRIRSSNRDRRVVNTQYKNMTMAYVNAANRLLQYYPNVVPTSTFNNTRFKNQNIARRIQTAERLFRNRRKLLRTQLVGIGSLVRGGLNLNTARKVVRNY